MCPLYPPSVNSLQGRRPHPAPRGGKAPNSDLPISFETVALPVARAKKMGIIAMKIFGQDALVGAAPPDKLLRYSLSLPVTTAVVGMPKLEHLEQNIQIARAFKALPRSEMRSLSAELSVKHKLALDHQMNLHNDHFA